MAAPGGKFFIQEKLADRAAHHESYAQLWETKWKQPVRNTLPRYITLPATLPVHTPPLTIQSPKS